MNLTVNQRVSGGFALLALLLIILSVISFNSINNIDNQLKTVTEEATPLVIASHEIIADLLQTGNDLAEYRSSRDPSNLKKLQSRYQTFLNRYKNNSAHLIDLAQHHDVVKQSVEIAAKDYKPYIESVNSLFNNHSKSVALDETIQELSSNFEDLADELDATLSDLADETSGQNKASLEKLNEMIQEATVTVTDGLQINQLDTLQTTINELQSLEQALVETLATVKNADSVKDAIDRFKSYIGIDGVLQQHKQRLMADIAVANTWNNMKEQLKVAKKSLNKVSTLASNLATKAKETAESSVTFSKSLIIVISLIAIAIAIAIGYWVSKSISKPLAVIAEVFAKVSAGDMTQTVDIKSRDEFGQLGQWINDLVGKLRKMLSDISNNSQQLSAAAEETSAITEQTRVGVEQQKDQIGQIATAMAEMAATVEDVANSANNAMDEVISARNQSAHGSEVVQQTRDTILHLSGEINRAGSVITKLDEHSSDIGAILDVIRGIADQTNLLALNAAIEAARAGEHGRGFSVVADEVRSLASKTQESTADIQHMIEELQQGTQEAVSVMENSQKEANTCVEKSDTASVALTEIASAIQAINDMSSHIAHAAKEQNTVTQEMHRNIEAISEISEQTALGATQTSEASHEQSNLANQLQNLVNRFRT
ncbi:MAG TPA: methyl-accepting chemotaxis protein [Aeromonadales bacterium]|nr:methyl-accepting chemotaxis protein [Aeromonadales bacterium]